MKILITGATGYMGNKLAMCLAENGNSVNVLVRNLHSANIPVHKNIAVFKGDVTDVCSIDAAIKDCKQVYHTAGLVKLFDKDYKLFYEVNVDGTRNLLEKSLEYGVEKFVYTSTCSVIGISNGEIMDEDTLRNSPLVCHYDISKYQAEGLVTQFAGKGLQTVIVSPSKIYGYSSVESKVLSVNKLIQGFAAGKLTFIPHPGSFIANYCFVDDVVRGHLLAMEKGRSGERYILGGNNVSYRDFFNDLRFITDSKAKLIEVPRAIVVLMAFGQWIWFYISGSEPFVTRNGIKHIYCNKNFSSEKAVKELGYTITSLSEGLKKTVSSYFKGSLFYE